MTYALITGASKGIGKSLAGGLAARQYNLLLVARSGEELSLLATQLTEQFKVTVNWLALDLSHPDAARQVYNWCADNHYEVSVLVNNAGYAVWGDFGKQSLDAQLSMVQVNAQTPVALCHYMLPLLQKHARSYILNVSSTAAYQAVRTLSLYSASKAFMLFFTRGIRQELLGTGVTVTCLCPGPVNTNFIERAGMQAIQATAEKFGMTPDAVAAIALKGLFKGKAEIIPGPLNAISSFMTRLVPKGLVEKIAGNLYKTK